MISRVDVLRLLHVSVGLMPIGLALAGPISEAVGLHETLYAMSAIGVGDLRRLPAHSRARARYSRVEPEIPLKLRAPAEDQR